MASTKELIEFWRKFEGKPDQDGPYVHPEDQTLLGGDIEERPSSDFEYLSTDGLKTALLPGPFQGDIESAKIIVCMLNPGVGLDSLHEVRDRKFRKAMMRQLRQHLKGVEYKFLSLDPEYCWTGGFSWWSRKFNRLIVELMKLGLTEEASRKRVAKHVAAVELFAYPSRTFGSKKLVARKPEIPSSKIMKSWIRQKAKNGAHIIVARGLEHWHPVCGKNVHVMASNYARGGWFLNNKNAPKYADIILNDL